MIPIVPHFAFECLEKNQFDFNQNWPVYNKDMLIEDSVKIVAQINGKKRALINTDRDVSEENLLLIIKKNVNLKKYLDNKEIKKVIFIKNKIINIII